MIMMLKILMFIKVDVDKKFKETPVPTVVEPAAPLRNVGTLVPGENLATKVFGRFVRG